MVKLLVWEQYREDLLSTLNEAERLVYQLYEAGRDCRGILEYIGREEDKDCVLYMAKQLQQLTEDGISRFQDTDCRLASDRKGRNHMPSVDRDLEEIVEFCKQFSQNLTKIDDKAQDLAKLGTTIESTLYNTPFSTKAASTVGTTAKKVSAAVEQGQQRIRALQLKVEEQIRVRDEYDRS